MASQALHVLALNSGSSSLKFGLYRVGPSQTQALLAGEAGSIGSQIGKLEAQDARQGTLHSESVAIPTHSDAIIRIGKLLADNKMPAPDAVGHRIVHGGPNLLRHCLVDDALLGELEAAAVFAPLHTPPALAVIRYAREHFPHLAQVACFDTSFHAAMPAVARVLPLPKELQAEGIRRYGFHGLSCESIVRQLAAELPDRLVIAHLGNGASITAVRAGQSIDTSMGLTPTGGVIMGTRSGDLDPGVLIYLLRQKRFDAAMLEVLVERRAGLRGISGIDSDMRRLHEAAPSNADARLAIQMFCASVQKQIAAMAAVLQGVDMLVFTGGIGENDAEVRATICSGLAWMGVHVDGERNPDASPGSASLSRCSIRVLASQENEEIARHTWALLPHSAA
jgi:acetate kinase